MGSDLSDGPFAVAGAEQVANSGQLFFRLSGPFLLFDGFDNGFGGGGNAFKGCLGRLNLIGGLVFGAQPADQAVAFFFGAFGVESDEAFENNFI